MTAANEASSTTTATTARQAPEPNGIPSEKEMGRAILKGWAVGVPGLFAIIFVIGLLAGASPWLAVEIAVEPALVCGGFLTAAIFIGLASGRASH